MTAPTQAESTYDEALAEEDSRPWERFFARRAKRRKPKAHAKDPEKRPEAKERNEDPTPVRIVTPVRVRRVRRLASPSQPPVATKEIRAHRPSTPPPRRVDVEARKELAEIQEDRRAFLRKTAIGAGILALGAGLGYGGRYAQAAGLSGNSRTVITDSEIAARVIAGVRIATEFIPDPVPAGTDADPYPGSAIQAALDDGLAVYIPSGTWQLTSTISRAADNVTIIGAGKSTKLMLNGSNSVISAGSQTGWLIANLAADAGGVDVSSGFECRVTEVWVDGILTDNRPIAPGGGGGTGGYYGVRAEDYITSGDGSPSNPYNASAIQNAVDALPARGGIVFIKEGVWQGSLRISVNANGSTPWKHVIFQGAGTRPYQIYGFSNNRANFGTHVIAGFDCYCPCDFFDMTISPVGLNESGNGISFIEDATKDGSDYDWTRGHTVKRVKFWYCDSGIRYYAQNMGSVFWQVWGIEIEQCGFALCNVGIRMSRGDCDSTAPSQGFRGRVHHCEFRACTGGRAFEFDISSSKMDIGWFLLEGCGASGGDYAIYVNTYGDGGTCVYNIDFGDGSNSPKDAYIFIGREGMVDALEYKKDIDIGGRGFFRFGGKNTLGSPVFNLVGLTEYATIERLPGTDNFTLGTVGDSVNRARVLLKNQAGANTGYIGSTTPTGSPYTYTNVDMQDEIVYLVGGAVSGVTRDGQSIPAGAAHQLSPGDSIVITYTSAPTIKRFGLS